MTFDVHPAATEEAAEARDWYDARSSRVADRFESELRDAFDQISQQPTTWPVGLHGTRFLTLERFPYVVVYRHRRDEILIVAIAHASRRPGYWKDRLHP